MTTVLSPMKHRPLAIVVLLIGGVLVASGALVGPAASASSDDAPVAGPALDEAIPDVVLQLPAGESFEADMEALLSDLNESIGVAWAAGDLTTEPVPNILVGLETGMSDVGLRAVEAVVADHARAETITIGGRAGADRALTDRIGRSVFVVVLLTAAAAAGMTAWLVRPHHGMLVGITVAISGWLGGSLGGAAAGPFDGSLVTSAVPAVLAALVVAICLSFRLLSWFAEPVGDDLADMIRQSVKALTLELVLFFAGLIVIDLFLEVVGPARSVATVALVGAATATFLTLAIVPPVLAGLHGAGIPTVPAEAKANHPSAMLRAVLESRPNGRDFPILVLLAFGFFFGFLALLALGTPTVPALLDQAALDGDDVPAPGFEERLLASGGDPTAATLAIFPLGTDQTAKSAWLQRVSQLPSVGRVDTSTGRYVGGQLTALEGNPVGAYGQAAEDDEAPRFALIVPTVTARSEGARQLLVAIEATNAPVNAELSGLPFDARLAAERDRSLVWVTLIALSLVAGVIVFVLVGDLALAGLTAGLRLLDSTALVGLYHLLANDVSGAELQLMVFTSGIGMGLFELGFLRRLLQGQSDVGGDDLIDSALNREGWAAAVALLVVGVGSLGFIGGGTAALTRLGVILAVGLTIEVVIGLWLLRPAVLGTRGISHFAARPVRQALRVLYGSGAVDEAERQRWALVVSDLLLTEFQFQADPGVANMDTVFEAGTPLFRKAVEHHQNLATAGLRIIGRSPELRTVRVVTAAPQVTVAVTVDHPIRQLVDQTGKIVGVRKAEQRSVMLWLSTQDGSSERIADSVELGAAPLGLPEAPVSAFPPVVPATLE